MKLKQTIRCIACELEFKPSVVHTSDDGSAEYECTICHEIFNKTQLDAYNFGYKKGMEKMNSKIQAYFKTKFNFIKQQKKTNAMLIGIDAEYDKVTAAWEIVLKELMEKV